MSEAQTEQIGLITPDFTQSPDLVASGIYKVRIKEVKYKPEAWTTRDGIKVTKLTWTLETFGEEEEKNNGRYIFHGTDINGPFARGLQIFYKAVMQEDLNPGQGFDPQMLYGRELEVTVGPQKKEPQYTEVKAVRPITH